MHQLLRMLRVPAISTMDTTFPKVRIQSMSPINCIKPPPVCRHHCYYKCLVSSIQVWFARQWRNWPRAMTHDETRFPDSMSFKPERHLSPTGELLQGSAVTSSSFGFGPYVGPQFLSYNSDASPIDDSVPESISPIRASGLLLSPPWQRCELGKGRTQPDAKLT
jgi:hypothetical protein